MAILTLEQAFRLAFEHFRNGERSPLERLYQKLTSNLPPYAEGLILTGILARELGRTDEFKHWINRAIAMKPELAHVPYQTAVVLTALGQIPQAIVAYEQTAAVLPANAQVRSDLGALLHQSGRIDEAICAYRDALAIHSTDARTLSNLGHALKEKGQLEESAHVLEQAIYIQPDLAAAHNNLGNTFEELNRPAEALAAYRKAVELEPSLAEGHNNLGNALQRADRFEEAIAAYSHAVDLNPNYPDALVNLGNALKDSGEIPRAMSLYRRAIELQPDSWRWSNYLLALYYDPSVTPEQILAEHRHWAMRVSGAASPSRIAHTHSIDLNRRLRIGYVSGDFRHHVVGYNLLPLLENHDHTSFEIFCYSTAARHDAITERFRASADHWLDVKTLSDDQLTQNIRADQIDILVDLALHSGSHRLSVFARKPAPIQLTFAGYPGTTGLSEIDYRLTDPYLDPPGQNDSLSSEMPWRLNHSFWCYQPLSNDPQINPLPALSAGKVTFGSLTNFCKINEPVLSLWARVLLAVPDSQLLLMSRDGPQRERTRTFLASRGVSSDRIDFVNYQPREQYLQTYHRIDIGLDTFPYNGHTTTLDSLWMGVPVVTVPGRHAVSRAGLSQLSNLGLPQFVARSPEDFIEIASRHATKLDELADLRQSLRLKMAVSPLMNAPQFARDIESAYRDIWKTHAGTRR